VIQARHTERQSSVIVKVNGAVWDPSREAHQLSLEDLVLAYMRGGASVERPPELVAS
jgi:ABC-2 type transport system ATP-binding protein